MGPSDRLANIKDKHDRTRVSVFQEASQEIDYNHRKAENEVGHELPRPDHYAEGVRRAKEAGANVNTSSN